MLQPQLFFGFPVDDEVDKELRRADPNALGFFLNNDSEYLHETVFQGVRHIGKRIGQIQNIAALDGQTSHLYSLFTKLLPQATFPAEKLLLFPVAQES
jgi:hypothetical protein